MKVSLKIEKFVGTGNDFLFVDESQSLPEALAGIARPELARRLCDRHFGAGADGLIFMQSLGAGRLRWDFYNNDGSSAEMCGNASRCVGRWAELRFGTQNVVLETAAGLVKLETAATGVTANLDYVSLKFENLQPTANTGGLSATLVNTGVPHAVIAIDDLAKARSGEFRSIIQAFRFHADAGERGANVTFVSALPRSNSRAANRFATVTFERGVEDFTLSCGTGVLAAAAVGSRALGDALTESPCEMRTPGGTLFAGFGAGWRGAYLTGPADFIYKADVSTLSLKDGEP